MLTPTSSRTENTRGAVETGPTGVAVVGAAEGAGTVVGPTVMGATVVGTTAAGGTDVVGASLLACAETAPPSGRVASSARDPGAKSRIIHAIPATIDPSRTAYVELSATHCESAAPAHVA